MLKHKVYSYLRFSDPKQAAGSSAERQAAYAKTWADERGLALDDSLSLRDEGLSAYHQRHVKQGALGAFLRAVDEGRIAPGSVLVVEGLDRLSRAEPIQAQAQLAQIVNAGITVVTASDGREYNREKLKAQPMELVYSLLVMIRAHEESDTKSKRVRAAIRRQCQGWIAGTYRGIIRNGKDPSWVRWTGSAWEMVPDRAEAMRLVIDRFRQGDGAERIITALKGQGLLASSTTKAALYKMLKRRDLIGDRTLTIDGEEFILPGYYPALISEAQFTELQAMNSQRFRRKGKGEIPGIMTGMSILFCGYCGSAIAAQNAMGKSRKPDGTLHDGHRRLHCCASGKSLCPVGSSCSAVPVERALLAYCSDQFNLSALLSGSDQTQILRATLADVRSQIDKAGKQLERVTEALMADEDSTPLAFVRKARELETHIAELKHRETAANMELMRASNRRIPAMSKAWQSLAEGTMAQDYDARLQCRQLVADTFERIVLYHRGATPGELSDQYMDLVLIAKGGLPRMIRLDRKTGAWRAMEEGQAIQ